MPLGCDVLMPGKPRPRGSDHDGPANLCGLGVPAQEATDPSGGVPEANWERLEERIHPHYFRAERGRRPYPLSVMLRVHIVQLCYNLSDPGMEDLLYEAESVRRFAGLRLSEPLPDESTILNFRHLLEEHHLGQGLFTEIKNHLEEHGVRLREGTIVDATIIEAPSLGSGTRRCVR